MRSFFSLMFTLSVLYLIAQPTIPSNIYPGQKQGMLFRGEATAVKEVTFELFQTKGDKSYQKTFKHREGVVFIKRGSAAIQWTGNKKTLTPGSIALITAGDKLKLKSTTDEPVEFYLFSYRSKTPMPPCDTCSSFARVWEDLKFNPHDRGGVRSFFSRRTSQTKRFEMHVTTLHGGLPSHPPHTHAAEEIILVIDGETEMEIGGKSFKGIAGDAYFVKSLEAHGIKNTGQQSCSYYAFQWE